MGQTYKILSGPSDVAPPQAGEGSGSIPASGSPFVWSGDLEDDCSLTVGDWSSHAECMCDPCYLFDHDDLENMEPPLKTSRWFVAVYFKGEPVFHSGDPGGQILDGSMARAIAEAIIRGNTEVNHA